MLAPIQLLINHHMWLTSRLLPFLNEIHACFNKLSLNLRSCWRHHKSISWSSCCCHVEKIDINALTILYFKIGFIIYSFNIIVTGIADDTRTTSTSRHREGSYLDIISGTVFLPD
ncbi:hypothetical protein OIU78_005925 [Salix suchowensis]|nr:hypothetical protein OIU78_005925 [Salix suchowensis]